MLDARFFILTLVVVSISVLACGRSQDIQAPPPTPSIDLNATIRAEIALALKRIEATTVKTDFGDSDVVDDKERAEQVVSDYLKSLVDKIGDANTREVLVGSTTPIRSNSLGAPPSRVWEVWTDGVSFENGAPLERSSMAWHVALNDGEQRVIAGGPNSRHWQYVITNQADLISWVGEVWCLLGGTHSEIWNNVMNEEVGISSVADSIRTIESKFLSSGAPQDVQYHFNLIREYFDTYFKFVESEKRSPSSSETESLVYSAIDSKEHAWNQFSRFAVDRYWWALPKDCMDSGERQTATESNVASHATTHPVITPPTAVPQQSCCKRCSKGKPCGNTCISRSKTCHVGRGCAC